MPGTQSGTGVSCHGNTLKISLSKRQIMHILSQSSTLEYLELLFPFSGHACHVKLKGGKLKSVVSFIEIFWVMFWVGLVWGFFLDIKHYLSLIGQFPLLIIQAKP